KVVLPFCSPSENAAFWAAVTEGDEPTAAATVWTRGAADKSALVGAPPSRLSSWVRVGLRRLPTRRETRPPTASTAIPTKTHSTEVAPFCARCIGSLGFLSGGHNEQLPCPAAHSSIGGFGGSAKERCRRVAAKRCHVSAAGTERRRSCQRILPCRANRSVA